ncbi:hypothetical protein [Streptomyces sp. NPDC000983]|uniref:hypothetical protein n=1 Tax=Streptomyces sp. NPDC000983 TaxID=3154373 RepID=UPI00332A3099
MLAIVSAVLPGRHRIALDAKAVRGESFVVARTSGSRTGHRPRPCQDIREGVHRAAIGQRLQW